MIQQIKEILAEIKEDPSLVNSLSDTCDIVNDVGLDSLQMVAFMLRLEEGCNVEIDFDNFNLCTMRTLSALCAFLDAERQKARDDTWLS
jgi:acyl carrier protein